LLFTQNTDFSLIILVAKNPFRTLFSSLEKILLIRDTNQISISGNILQLFKRFHKSNGSFSSTDIKRSLIFIGEWFSQHPERRLRNRKILRNFLIYKEFWYFFEKICSKQNKEIQKFWSLQQKNWSSWNFYIIILA